MNKLIYLASPYRHKDVRIERLRYEQVCLITASLIKRNHLVFSPIVNSHHLYIKGLTKGDDSILEWDVAFLSHCHELWALCMDGWEDSKGMKREIEHARDNMIPIKFINREEIIELLLL